MQKFDITAEEIDRLVAVFYERIRAHPMLGPIFARAIAPEDGPEWRAHEAQDRRLLAQCHRHGPEL